LSAIDRLIPATSTIEAKAPICLPDIHRAGRRSGAAAGCGSGTPSNRRIAAAIAASRAAGRRGGGSGSKRAISLSSAIQRGRMTNRQWPVPLRQGRRETDIDRVYNGNLCPV
jgi:hypothetical protein